jgi:hypothetical protein
VTGANGPLEPHKKGLHMKLTIHKALLPLVSLAGLAAFGFTGCDDGYGEKSGEAIDDAVEDIEEGAEEAGDKIEDAVDDLDDK